MLQTVKRIGGALLLGALLAVANLPPAQAQAQSQAQQSANDAALMEQLKGKLTGRVSIPDEKSATLVQPQGREWREVLEGPVKSAGGWLLVAVIVVLAAFFAWRGRVRVEGGFSGRTVERFNALDRFTHWLTAVSFVILGLSGLNMTFGRRLILPLIGPESFHSLTTIGKWSHDYVSFAFVFGVFLMAVLWIRHNFFRAFDVEWLREGGGLLKKGVHPPAGKFNAGQKIIFWLVILGALVQAVSGYMLMFPFYVADMAGMQLSLLVHAVAGLLFVALILAHIYIGTLGMEGAFDAMGTGQVDVNWAKEHHSLWAPEAPGARATGDDD
ncbi:MAG TPA: formate dehydrogenase subunit gamma [Alphaproteobacteria bacterium]